MEPFEYPDNDPGPQTLLYFADPEQNIDRLHWLISRFQGYVGLASTMGGAFHRFGTVVRADAARHCEARTDLCRRRLQPAERRWPIAGGDNLPFARADVVIDAVPTPTEIDHALGRLEMAARERNVAVGIASALPVSIDRIAKWAKAAASRGLQLVPITAVALKAKQTMEANSEVAK